MDEQQSYETIIVGGGPAGLSAATVLGRCLRRVLVLDNGEYRNAAAQRMWGYLSRDGIAPSEFREIGRQQLARYPSVTLRHATVTEVGIATDTEIAEDTADGSRFWVALEDGKRLTARKLLLATGVVDEVPQIEGIERFYGTSIFHCPYCDGYEVRGQAIAIYGQGYDAAAFTLEMTVWSRDLVLLTDGPGALAEVDRDRLQRYGIPVREEHILRLEGTGGQLERIVFDTGAPLPRQAMFFSMRQRQRSPFPAQLGCQFTAQGGVETNEHEATCVPGVYVAGDASKREQYAVVSAAEGALAATAINEALTREDLARAGETLPEPQIYREQEAID
ncbi:MAG TPA: NAD(P)/FAD-dependent oxidoreductase [Ktedonobacterales bacterium]|nr:NAD(P)/FAD-dependent oxidoreductase [Ktedonobacterales bacterium]